MSEALEYLYTIYNSMLDLLFNRFYMFEGVSVGWVAITVIIFSIVIRSILNVPRRMSFREFKKIGGKTNGRIDSSK